MREIEFRSWHRNHERMFYVTMIDWVLGEICGVWIDDLRDGTGIMSLNMSELMQFTGLLDSKGKKIWEGDIWQWIGGAREVIEWCPNMCCFNIDYNCQGEVIGNVWENLELLQSPTSEGRGR